MKHTIRKNESLPECVAGAVAEDIFRHLEVRPKSKQAERVERILDLLSRLGRGDVAAFFQKGEMLNRYEWHYGLTYSRGRGLRAELTFTKELPEEDAWEHRAVRFLLGLVPHNIHRLRRCAYEGCNGWFFAEKRADQTFCKRGVCRQNYYDSAPEMRESKKLYMRQYRKDLKEQDQRAKERLRRKK